MAIEFELQKCEECKTYYQPTRKHQRFCSKKCNARKNGRERSRRLAAEKKGEKIRKRDTRIDEKFLERGKVSYYGYRNL